jgi:hypothetical protein
MLNNNIKCQDALGRRKSNQNRLEKVPLEIGNKSPFTFIKNNKIKVMLNHDSQLSCKHLGFALKYYFYEISQQM